MRGHLAQDAHLAGELGEHRRRPVGSCRPARPRAARPPRAAPSRPRARRRAARRSTSAARSPPPRTAGSPRPCSGAGSSGAKSSFTASARWRVALSNGPSASRSGGSSDAVHLHHVQVRHARREVLATARRGRRPPRAPRRRRRARPRADHAAGCCRRSGSSGRARGSAGRRSARSRRRLACRGSAPRVVAARHHPKTRAAFAVHRALQLLVRRRRAARPRTRAVCATFAGSFGLPRTGCGAR